MKRIGMAIGVVPEKLELYKKLHADGNVGVRPLLKKYHFSNFSIFITKMDDGKDCLFGYYEYVGNDFEKDDKMLHQEPEYIKWLAETDACQMPFNGETSWRMMEKVFFMQ